MRYLIATIISLTISFSLFAQPVGDSKYEQKIEAAEMSLESNNVYNALELFEEAYKESKDRNLLLAIADLSFSLRDYKKAERYYARILKRDKTGEYLDLRFDRALSMKYQGKYDEAVEEFRVFVSETEDEELRKRAELEMEGIRAMDAFEDNIGTVVDFGGKKINAGQSEYSPVLYEDESLYFASYQFHKKIEVEENGDSELAKIYFARKDDKGMYGKPAALGEHINRPGVHTSNVSFSSDFRKMYFTRTTLQSNTILESKIYVSYRKDNEWGAAQPLIGVNGDYIAKHPREGELFGKEVLFFTSNMDGGYGGDDIYYATLKSDTEYELPVNLGEVINTPYDEVTPFYTDGTLYYSSNGHPGMGGLDAFYSIWDGTAWSTPENMGHNYNSSYDDLYLNFEEDGFNGFLVSNRPFKKKRSLNGKSCCDDIYTFNIRQTVIELLASVHGEEGPLDGAAVELMDKSAPEEIETQIKTNKTGHEFNFLLDGDHEYRAIVSHPDYYSDTITFNTIGIIDDFVVKKKVTLKPTPKKPKTEIVKINEPIRLTNIYYDFDDDEILPAAETDLQVLHDLMLKYSDMVIELSSHTDAQGISRYNENLSQRRAESAKDWLVNKGVDEERIVAKGYGESVILNHCVNGVRCSDDEHRENRRTEFKIIAGPTSIEITREVISDERVKSVFFERNEWEQSLSDKPVLTLKETTVDIGKVRQGDFYEVFFEFVNSGKKNLQVELVTGCDCLAIEWTEDEIPPGYQGGIRVVLDTSKVPLGKLKKTIDIISNTEPMVTEVWITGLIEK